MQNLILKLDWPLWIFFFITLLLLSITIFYYYKTLPPLSNVRRTFSIIIRAAGLIIIFFLLLKPIFQFIFKQNEKPVLAFVFDNSASMKIPESYGLRGDSLTYIMKKIPELNHLDSLEFKLYIFDLQLQKQSADSLTFETDGTDISKAIQSVKDSLSGRNLQGIFLVSDGIYNQGANPLLISQKENIPVFTIIVGDSTVQKDIAIKRVHTNPVTYLNKKLPIEVVLWQNGFDNKKAILSVYKGKNRIAKKTVTLVKSGFEQKEKIVIIPKEEGDFTYSIEIQNLPDEITEHNNFRKVSTKVLKSKVKVLVLGDSPNYDRHFLKYISDKIDDYLFLFLTEKTSGKYYESNFNQLKLDSIDIVMFLGYPTSRTPVEHIEKIFDQINKRKLPLFWLINQSIHLDRLNKFNNMVPFYLDSQLKQFSNISVMLTSGGSLHPVTRIEENMTSNDLIWSALPPIEIYYQIKLKEGSQILVETNKFQSRTVNPQKYPALFAYRHNEIKHLVLAASNFGFWHFQLQEDPIRDQFFHRFIERSIRWLINRDDINQVQIQSIQRSYNLGEQAIFSGQVYDEFYNPITDAQIKISVNGSNVDISDEMDIQTGGYYRYSLGGLPEGEFKYKITAGKNDRNIGVRYGKFSINPFYLEFQQISVNVSLMKQLARNTGGEIFQPAEFIRDFEKLNFKNRIYFSFSEYFLWSYIYWLFVLIILFSIEWFFRKRWGLL